MDTPETEPHAIATVEPSCSNAAGERGVRKLPGGCSQYLWDGNVVSKSVYYRRLSGKLEVPRAPRKLFVDGMEVSHTWYYALKAERAKRQQVRLLTRVAIVWSTGEPICNTYTECLPATKS